MKLVSFPLSVTALLLSAASCKTQVTSPPAAPTEQVQPRPTDARPAPIPERAERGPPEEGAVAPASAGDVAAFAAARPALEKHCFRCHTTGGKKAKAKTLKHLSFDQYPPGGHHAHEAGPAFRRVLLGNRARGKAPTMPADDRGAVTGEDLEKILVWADAFDRAHAGHRDHRAPSPARSP